MGRHTYRVKLSLFTKPVEFFPGTFREMLFFRHAEKEKNIDLVCAQLAEPLFQGATKVRMPQEKVINPRGGDIVFSFISHNLSEHADHLHVYTEVKEIVHSLIQSPVDGLFAREVCCREAKAVDGYTSIAKYGMGKVLIQGCFPIFHHSKKLHPWTCDRQVSPR
jgi:hypothetical protein